MSIVCKRQDLGTGQDEGKERQNGFLDGRGQELNGEQVKRERTRECREGV